MFPMMRSPTAALTFAAVLLLAGLAISANPSWAKSREQPAAAQDENQPQYSKEFRKRAGAVQKDVTASRWPEVLEGVKELEALPELTRDDQHVILNWKLQAQLATGDKEGLIATIERFIDGGFATPEQLGPMHQQLAAWYNGKKDMEKTVLHYRKYIDATADVAPADLVTMGRLYLQTGSEREGITWLQKAITTAEAAGEQPEELWYQLLDRSFVNLEDTQGRIANLVALVEHYPKSEYYTRILALFEHDSKEDRVLMINTFRLACADTGLNTVGEYLEYADTALIVGSPGEAARALEKGMKAGIVPAAGSNQQSLQEAQAAMARDRRDLPKDEVAAAKNPKGEVDVKVGLGYYSLGEWAKTVEAVQRGLAKGGVKRIDDANLLLGAAQLELGQFADASEAFGKAAAAAQGEHMRQVAEMWGAYVKRREAANGAG